MKITADNVAMLRPQHGSVVPPRVLAVPSRKKFLAEPVRATMPELTATRASPPAAEAARPPRNSRAMMNTTPVAYATAMATDVDCRALASSNTTTGTVE